MKRIRTLCIWICVTTLLALPVLGYFVLQNGWVRQQFLRQVEKFSTDWINGSLSIGTIEGTLLGDATLRNIYLYQNNDTILKAGSIRLKFKLWPLLRQEITVDSIILDSIRVLVATDTVHGLNWSNLLPPSPPDTIEVEPSNWKINVPSIQLRNAKVRFRGFAEILPSTIDSIALHGSFKMHKDSLNVTLEQLNAVPNNPWPPIQNLTGVFTMAESQLSLQNITLTTQWNHLLAGAIYNGLPNFESYLDWKNPEPEEFTFALPDLTFSKLDSFYFDIHNHTDTLKLYAGAVRNLQQIDIKGHFLNFSKALSNNRAVAPFQLELKLNRVVASDWIKQLPSELILAGNIQLEGEGLDFTNHHYRLSAQLDKSSFQNIKPSLLRLQSWLHQNTATIQLDARYNNTPLQLKSTIHSLNTSPRVAAKLNMGPLDISQIDSGIPLRVEQGEIQFSGSLQPVPTGKGTLQLRQLQTKLLPAINLKAEFSLLHDAVKIDSLWVDNEQLETALQASYQFGNKAITMVSKLRIHPSSYHYNKTIVSVKKAEMDATLEGTPDKLFWNARGTIDSLQSDSLKLTHFGFQSTGSFAPKHLKTETHISLENGAWGSYFLNQLKASAILEGKNLQTTLDASLQDSIILQLQAHTLLGDTIQFNISRFQLGTPSKTLQNDQTIQFAASKNLLNIGSFEIKLLQDPSNLLSMNGQISLLGISDFTISIHQLELQHLQPFFTQTPLPKGKFTADLTLTGSPNQHQISGNIEWNKIQYAGIEVFQIKQSLMLTNQKGLLHTEIFNNLKESLALDARANYLFHQEKDRFELKREPSFEFESTEENIALFKIIPPLPELKIPQGTFSYHLLVSGPLTRPLVNGYMAIRNASVQIPKSKTDLHNINTYFRLDGDKLYIDTLQMQSGKGSMHLTGMADFDSSLITSRIQDLEMNLHANEFKINYFNLFDFTINADASIQSPQQKPTIDGQIEIIRGEVGLDEFLSSGAPETYRKNALLMQALHPKADRPKLEKETTSKIQSLELTQLSQKLGGKINLKMPRNVWIKGEGTSLELSGDLDLIKSASDFELFGKLNIQRGYYTISGKRLNINKGNLVFHGGKEIDPTLQIEAQYTFRGTNKVKQNLLALIEGTLTEPQVSFTLDSKEISRSDAFSYLVFGKSIDELSSGDQKSVSDASAGQAMAGMLASELSKVLADKLRLDVFEFEAADNWENAAFMIGKYITQNLFVVYQRSFGKATENELTPETITLEYELNKHLFFRLQSGKEKTSGVDVILKLESKP